MTRTALLTGVTGFIGGRLARRLTEEGWAVHVIVRPSSRPPADLELSPQVYDGSLSSMVEAVRRSQPDVVFHLASLYLAEHRPDQVDDLVASNVLLPTHLAEAMRAAGACRLVNTGTAWQHFGTDGYNPVNLYAATKQACLDLLRFYHDAHGLSVVTLKLFDTYGAGDPRRKLVQLLIDAARSGEELGMSPGDQLVDLTHVEDVVEAFVVAADHLLLSQPALFQDFLVSGERSSVKDLVGLVAAAASRPIHARFGARPYRAREVMTPAVPAASRLLPGWSRRRSLGATVAALAAGRDDD